MIPKAEQYKPIIIQRLKEGRNLAEIAEELRLSPHALPHYIEDYKDEGLIEGDGRTVEGLSVEGTEITFRPEKPCGFPNCAKPKKRSTMNQLASKYCAEHLRAYQQLRQKHHRETDAATFHYSYAEFEAEVLGESFVENGAAPRALTTSRQCTFPDCPNRCGSSDKKSLHSRLCETHLNQYAVWRNAELAGHATAPAPKQKEGMDDEYVFRYTVKDFIRDATEPGDWERAGELSAEARRVLEELSVISHTSAFALKAERPVLNTLLGRNFIRERGDGHYDITAQGRAAIPTVSAAIGRDNAADTFGENSYTPAPATPTSISIEAAADELRERLSEFEAQNHESEVRWREIVEGIAVSPIEGERPGERSSHQNGHLSEVIAPDPFVRDTPELNAGFDITVYSRMQGIEVHVRVAPFSVRDMPVEDVVAYFTSIGTQVGLMLKFHNQG